MRVLGELPTQRAPQKANVRRVGFLLPAAWETHWLVSGGVRRVASEVWGRERHWGISSQKRAVKITGTGQIACGGVRRQN